MEERLVEEASAGNRHSLAKLLHDNYEMVYKYLIKFTLSRNTAEDLVQDTMIRAVERFGTYDPKKSRFSTWLIAIAQNLYIDSIRKNKREQRHLEQEIHTEDFFEVQERHDEDWDRTLDALARLPGESRMPLVMKHYYGYSLEEIARIMGIPTGTVKSRIHNAIKAVRKEMDIDGGQ